VKPVDLFHIGPQKAATTWVYRCLQAHPEVACPARHEIHYFDVFYARGRGWYESFFTGATEGQKLFDPTTTYIRSPWAAERIAEENSAAQIVLCLRNPIERAHSHWWHERKKEAIRYDFAEVLGNYDLFASWVEPGFYARHLERFFECFPRDQILCQRFEDLERDPQAFLRELLTFAGVDASLRPPVLYEKVNVAGPRQSWREPGYVLDHTRRALSRAGVGYGAVERARRAFPWLRGRADYEAGIDPTLFTSLLEICEPEIERLEELLGIDLEAWRQPPADPE
jgi:hypothetical protein